ncbi:MAG TPA: hypothetical protein VK978_02370 [Candidatus Saccharimonadales bacterium]|nr:hypothetical protein [Candidatus Saccharimonadales bacterium]
MWYRRNRANTEVHLMDNVETASLLIRLSIGIVMVLFGISQIKAPQQWLDYIPGFIRFLMPVKPASFMRLHGLGNLSLGLLLMSGWLQPLSLWLALAWWAWVLPFAFFYNWTVGLRDFAIIMALATLLLVR